MANIKKKEYFDCITGDCVNKEMYGVIASVFKKVDNVDMVYSSRGEFLGLRTCRGMIINGKYTAKKGIWCFKSFTDLNIWSGVYCTDADFIETDEGNFMQIRR